MIKKIFSIICALALIATLAACGAPTGQNNNGQPPGGNGGEDQITIGIIQLVEHPSLTLIRTTFIEEMRNLGYDNVEFIYQIGQPDMTLLTQIAESFVGQGVDMIVAIATMAAQAAKAVTQAVGSDIPVIFAAATAPVQAGLVVDLNHPDANVTGTSDIICVESIFELAQRLTPDARTFGFVYNLGEINSVTVINNAKELFAELGFTYLEATVTSTADVQQAALSLVGRVDAFFTPIDNTVAAAMPVFAQVATDAGLPIYTGADSMVMDGGFATVGIDYAILGAETARLVSRALGGTPISQLPVVSMQDFRTIVNRATADALGITIDGLVEPHEIYEG